MPELSEQDDREALIARLHDVAGQLGESSLKAGGNEGLRNAANEITVVADALAHRTPAPQQVSTVEEVWALPVGSVIQMTGTKAPFYAHDGMWFSTAIEGKPVYDYIKPEYLPATVLYRPEGGESRG